MGFALAPAISTDNEFLLAGTARGKPFPPPEEAMCFNNVDQEMSQTRPSTHFQKRLVSSLGFRRFRFQKPKPKLDHNAGQSKDWPQYRKST